MCGIVGVIGKFELHNLNNAISSIVHRGPDFQNIFYDNINKIGLGHTRLSIIDTSSNGNQPMILKDKSVIVFNGEIYNFRELKNNLIDQGCKFKSNSDTEVLLHLYSKYGYKMLEKLNGIFAFAIWDKKEKIIFLARDNFGVKPLYYLNTSNSVAFASEIKALIELRLIEEKINVESLIKYISFMWCPGNKTPIKGINKLEPGEAMIVDASNNIKKWKWYNPVFFNNSLIVTKDELIHHVQNNLEKSVERQMISDVPIATLLSGGVDSSTITAIAKKYDNKINAFTINFSDGNEDEMEEDFKYANLVSDYLNVNLHYINFDHKNFISDIEKMIYHMDEPISDLAPLNLFYISKYAKSLGYKVLLSGLGADDIFTGYRRHNAIYFSENYKNFSNLLLKAIKISKPFLNSNNKFFRRLNKFYDNSDSTVNNTLANFYKWGSNELSLSLFHRDVREILMNFDPLEPIIANLSNMPKHLSDIDKMLQLEQRFFLGDHNLIYTDKMSMANGVEIRVPFLDFEFVEFVNQIPYKYKINTFNNKVLLKEAMKNKLPKEIFTRKKAGFGAPVRKWMKNELREIIYDTFSSSEFINRGLFDKKAVNDLIEKNLNGEIDGSYTLLSLLCIEIWCKTFKISL